MDLMPGAGHGRGKPITSPSSYRRSGQSSQIPGGTLAKPGPDRTGRHGRTDPGDVVPAEIVDHSLPRQSTVSLDPEYQRLRPRGSRRPIVASALAGFSLGIVFIVAMVVLMSGYILYDTSQILHHYRTDQHVAAALALFASVAMLFWYVVQLLMRLNDD